MGANVKAKRKRLLVLADFLEGEVLGRIDGAKFDMQSWGDWTGETSPDSIEKTSACGFEGCAIGWGYYCEPLVKSGVRRLFNNNRQWDRGVSDWDKAAAFFGLTYEEFNLAFILSDDHGKRGIRKTVARLRKIAAQEPQP